MSNSKAAEPVQVAPFLTHVVSHHGRLTLIPPENAGRVRKNSKVQAKKEKKQMRGGERGGRSDDNEEPRFNLGIPRSVKSGSGRRKTARAPVPGRSREPETREPVTRDPETRDPEGGYGEDIDIPDYPPPSFQEATSSSVQLQMLSIPLSATASYTTAQSSTTSSPISDCSPTTSMTQSQRMLSIVVEPSSSPPSSPNPSPSSLSSSPSKLSSGSSCFASQPNHKKSNFPLPPIPQSPTSDTDSETSLDFVSLPLEPSQRQWDEDRLLGLPLEERVKREAKRQRAAQIDSPQPREPDAQSPTQAEPSRCKSSESLAPDRGRGKGPSSLHVPPHPSSRLKLDEPSIRSMPSNPSLAQGNSKRLSPLSPLRPSSPTSVASKPYNSLGPASSSLSLSLGHLRLPGAFGRSTTSLGAFSSLSSGREGSGSRRLFLKGKGKEKARSFSDGEFDEREEESLDSWEVIDEEPMASEPGPSTPKIRPRLSLKPLLKPSEISISTYDEKAVEGKGARENDTRVDPFPISAEPSSPEMDSPSSISHTPTHFYPPPTPFSCNIVAPSTSSLQPPTETHYPTDVVRRPRYVSMRSCQPPTLPALSLNRHVHSPPPPSPPPRTGSARPTSPYLPTSPSRPSPLSGVSIPTSVSPSLRSPMSVLTPTKLQSPTNRRTPPPPPSKTNPILSKLNISRALEGHEVPLPPTPSESDSVISRIRGWPSTMGAVQERETEREVGRLYGYSSGPHPFFTSSIPTTYTQPMSQGDCPARARPVDYTHAPPVPSRLALSIPTYSRSPSLAPMSFAPSPATPRGCHYPGRPLPSTPGISTPVTPSAVMSLPIVQDQGHHCCLTHGHAYRTGTVPEGLLIDFDTDLNANTSSGEGIGGSEMDRTTAAVENGSFSISSVSTARSAGSTRGLEGVPRAIARSPVAATSGGPQFSEYTDLDLLASRLAEGNRNGSDYDALLLVQEFVGPAARNLVSNVNVSSPPAASATLGKIAIERRRVTKDGRVKLKMTLLGVMVDKCGICLSQFKDGEQAALGPECHHGFHKNCLRTWLATSPTCPMCRIPLGVNDPGGTP